MKNHTYKEIKNIYGKISPFEFKYKLIDIAKYTAKENNRELQVSVGMWRHRNPVHG